LLHDTVEDCPDVGVAGIYDRFGHDIGFLVEAVTDHPLYFIDDTETIYNDKIEKILAG
jgi:(p)ppGpp synthase/HD superfamily hydrolase